MTTAVTDRTSCTSRFHGDESAYRQGCRCLDAREDKRIKTKRRRHGIHTPVDVCIVGTSRRLQALAAIGWPIDDLTLRLNTSASNMRQVRRAHRPTVHRELATAVTKLYERLSATPGPSELVRGRAARWGWAPPLLWEDVDIDDPAAQPSTDEPVRTRAQIDLAEVDFFTGPLGMTLEDAAIRIGVQPGSIRIAQARARQKVAA